MVFDALAYLKEQNEQKSNKEQTKNDKQHCSIMRENNVSDRRQLKEREKGKRATHVLELHSMQSFDFLFPVWSDALPGGHSLQSVALATPVADEYVPSGHPIQTLLATAPISVEYNPAGHSVVCFNIHVRVEDKEYTYQ